jgi:hypothetical protein
MAFDKEEYRKNRDAGHRGQGPTYRAAHLHRDWRLTNKSEQWKTQKQPGRYALRKNTKRARKQLQTALQTVDNY